MPSPSDSARPGPTRAGPGAPAADAGWLGRSLRLATRHDAPFAHWTMPAVLSGDDCTALLAWEPGQQARGGAGGGGRRDTRNGRRAFITPALRHARPDLDRLAARFDDRGMRRLIAARTGARLGGTALRMELCFDTEGFWLEPHTDIGAKRLTLLIGLSTDHRAEGWGTDLMTPDGQVVKRASGRFNNGLMFVPGRDTWHGFAARRIEGERRTLIVNFVDRSWQSREELA